MRSMKHFKRIALVLLICCGHAVGVSGAGEDPLSVEDAVTTHDLTLYSAPRISPDGKWLAYTLTDKLKMHDLDEETWAKTGVPVYAVGTDIFLSNLKTGESLNVTGGMGSNWRPSWSPDGRYLAFNSDRDGSSQAKIWVYDLRQKELILVSAHKARMLSREIQWTPDSRAIVVATIPQDLSVEEYVRRFHGDAVHRDVERSRRLTSTISLYRSSGGDGPAVTSDPWNLNLYLCDLTVLDLTSGKSRAIVRNERIGSYRISPDGLRVAYSRMERFEQPGSQQIVFSLLSVALEGADTKQTLASNIHLRFDGTGFSWSPDSTLIGYRALGSAEAENDCYVVNRNGTELRNVTHLGPHSRQYISRTPIWDRTGKFVYFTVEGRLWRAAIDGEYAREIACIPDRQISVIVSNLDDRLVTSTFADSVVVLTRDEVGRQDGFYRIDLATAMTTRLLERGQCYTCRDTQEQHDLAIVTPDGAHVLYLTEDAQHDTNVWSADADFKAPSRVTDANPQFSKYRFGSSRLVNWLSDDGEKLEGALLLPPGFQDETRYPLVVMVYGGDRGSDRLNQFGGWGSGPFNLQLLATRGFVVFLPDAPQNLGTPMLDLAKTVLPGINKLIEIGIADPRRLGVMGQSYGGYSVMSLLVQTKRFKAAVESDGYADIIGSYGIMRKSGAAASVSNEETGQGLMGGPPWEYPLRYLENSPIFYLNRVSTPLLILHGEDDESVGAFLGDELFVGLRRLGNEVDYAKYQCENHYAGVWSYANQLDYAERMIDWFQRHLKAESSN